MKTKVLLIIVNLIFFFNEETLAQWPQWRGPNRDGISLETNLLNNWPVEGPTLLWSADFVGDGFSSTVIQDDIVYTIGKQDSIEVLTALDISGKLIWQMPVGEACRDQSYPQSRSTPTIFKNSIYVIGTTGDVSCFDCKTGKAIWKTAAFDLFGGNRFWGTAESPLVFDDKIIVTPVGTKATMVALNRLTGETIWQTEALNDSTSFCSPILFPNNSKNPAIFMSSYNSDFIIDSSTGKFIWKDQHLSGTIPTIYNEKIYSTGELKQKGTMCSWDKDFNKRTIVWNDSIGGNFMGGSVILENKLIVPEFRKNIYCMDPDNGKIFSIYNTSSPCNLMVADNKLFVFDDKIAKVSLLKLNADTLELRGSFRVKIGNGPCIAHLAISNGILYVRRGNVLMAYDIKEKS